MLSCLLSDTIYVEEQKLISLLGLYSKAATLRRSSVERYATFRYVTWGSADVRNLLPSV